MKKKEQSFADGFLRYDVHGEFPYVNYVLSIIYELCMCGRI